jgi:hypothetical protein
MPRHLRLNFTSLATLLLLSGCGDSPLQPTEADEGLTIVSGSGVVTAGQEMQLYLQSATPEGDLERVYDGVRWSTSDARVATVRADGVLVPTGQGEVLVEAWYGGRSAATTVKVTGSSPCDLAAGASLGLEIGVGETRMLTQAEAACLRLAPHAGAAYALAYADLRNLRRAEVGAERITDDEVDVVVGYNPDASRASAAQSRLPMERRPGTGDLVSLSSSYLPAPSFSASPGPPRYAVSADLRAGETFTFQGGQDSQRRVHVERVYSDYYVLGIDEELRPTLHPRQLAAIDSAFRVIVESGERILGSLTERRPTSIAGSEKMLVVFTRAADPAQGPRGLSHAHAVQPGQRVTSHVTIALGERNAWSAELVSLLAHELAHTRQHEHMSATAPNQGVPNPYFPWSAEGGADLVAQEVVREHLGIRPLQPIVLDDRLDASGREWRFYYSVGALAKGSIGSGYNDAAGFLRHLLEARVRDGEGYERALEEVVNGAVEGWYGYDSKAVRRTGLTARMRARLGSAWSPASAMLTYALAMATDERTTNPRLQSLSFSGMPGSAFTWRPYHTFRGGASEEVRLRSGSSSVGFVYLEGGDGAGRYAMSPGNSDTGWMLVRYR